MYWRALGSGGEWKKEPDSVWDDEEYRLACMGKIELGSEEYIREEAMSNKVEAATHAPCLPTARAVAEITATFPDVQAEIARAVGKHGYTRTPLWVGMTDREKLAVLVEEVGEVAHALNYDSADQDNLKAELIQVATMALAWRASLS